MNAFDTGDTRATVLICNSVFEDNRRDGIRVYEKTSPTLQSFMGTGGNNIPYVFPIQDGRDMEKNQNELGVGSGPAYTLDQTGAQAVAYSVREDSKANTFSATQTDVSLALQPSPQSHHAQLFITTPLAFDTQFGSNANVFEDQSPPLKASQQPPSISQSVVRRLTPLECERLQGFPDGWTEGQTDSHRYKQMGNAVAVPVVEWIIGRLLLHLEEPCQ